MNASTKFPLPNPAELRHMIELAFDKERQADRDEANKVVAAFTEHIAKLLANPKDFTSRTRFGYENPHYDTANYFYEHLRKLLPGYKVEKGHDGGGMYEVVYISWEDTPRWPRAANHRNA